ncbi:hypothetical protein Mapa_002589 [Marchantia paleacea]|nr:hypothetical protein Mapa_002589 [Marchantia paleacea]
MVRGKINANAGWNYRTHLIVEALLAFFLNRYDVTGVKDSHMLTCCNYSSRRLVEADEWGTEHTCIAGRRFGGTRSHLRWCLAATWPSCSRLLSLLSS